MNTATLLVSESSEVASILRQSPIPDLRFLDIEESEEEIVITGLVGSYYMKQLAQETIRGAVGARRIRNRVLVSRKF